MEFQGYSNYNSLQTRLEKCFSQGLSTLVSFTWGKTLADAIDQLASGGDATTYQGVKRGPQNGYDRRSEYGPADFDIALRLNVSAVWQIPYGQGRHFGSSSNQLVNAVLGGWEFSPIAIAEGGLPLTIAQPQLLNLGSNRVSRPNRLANGALPSGQCSVNEWFNVNAFEELQTNPSLSGFCSISGVRQLRGRHPSRAEPGDCRLQSRQGIPRHGAADAVISLGGLQFAEPYQPGYSQHHDRPRLRSNHSHCDTCPTDSVRA